MFLEHFPKGEILVWQHGDRSARGTVRERLLSRKWQLCISFYNDYVFSREEIVAFGCVVNIHPAMPFLRGRGYDTLPLIEQHREHGATLHFVSEEIDAGEIIEVLGQPVPPGISYPEFRIRTQMLSLAMLERLLLRSRNSHVGALNLDLKRMAEACEWRWSGEAVTSEKLGELLRELRRREPDHLALRDIPSTLVRHCAEPRAVDARTSGQGAAHE